MSTKQIGDTVEYENKTYVLAPETNTCTGCAFENIPCHKFLNPLPFTCSDLDCIFVKVITILTNKDSGLNGSYYEVKINHPTKPDKEPYLAECNDITEALKMTPHEYNIFKSVWRKAAARLGNGKADSKALYDAQKCLFAAQRMVVLETLEE